MKYAACVSNIWTITEAQQTYACGLCQFQALRSRIVCDAGLKGLPSIAESAIEDCKAYAAMNAVQPCQYRIAVCDTVLAIPPRTYVCGC